MPELKTHNCIYVFHDGETEICCICSKTREIEKPEQVEDLVEALSVPMEALGKQKSKVESIISEWMKDLKSSEFQEGLIWEMEKEQTMPFTWVLRAIAPSYMVVGRYIGEHEIERFGADRLDMMAGRIRRAIRNGAS
jgi:hypothetical protein